MEPVVRPAMLVANSNKPSPTRFDYFAAGNASSPLRRGERVHGDDGVVGSAGIPGPGVCCPTGGVGAQTRGSERGRPTHGLLVSEQRRIHALAATPLRA